MLRCSAFSVLVLSAFCVISSSSSVRGEESLRPSLIKLPLTLGPGMENTPVVYEGRPLLVMNYRDDSKDSSVPYTKRMHLMIRDLTTGQEIAKFGDGFSFVSALVKGKEMHVFACQGTDNDWFKSIYHFVSTDLKNWTSELVIPLEGNEHLFNCSVCEDNQGYTMAYESNQPVQFCFKFARSKDLAKWEKLPGLAFTGETHEYSACPVIRYFAPYYYVIYLHSAVPGYNGWVPFMARSKDLMTWQLSPMNPILAASDGEGTNNSDVDLFEWEGNTYLFYATGDQATWGSIRVAMYAGSLKSFYEHCFPEGQKMIEVSTKE